MKTGLVLEGGAMRGIYTAGVLDILMEEGITFDGVIGVSAGAIHGCSFVSNQAGRSIRYYKKYSRDKRFMSFRSLLRTGDIVDEKFCYHELPEQLDLYDYEAFLNSPTEFYVTCSNLTTGRAEYLKITDMKKEIDLMRASASMPYVSRIVHYQDKKLLDGGCTDSIPLQAFQKMGFEKNVVVLTRHDGYAKKPANPTIPRIIYHRYPRFAEAIRNRHQIYNQTLSYIRSEEDKGSIFVIRPSIELTIGRMEHDPAKIEAVYHIGRKDAREQLANLKTWLAS